MKKKLIIIFSILLISMMVAGTSMAWFKFRPNGAINEFKIGTVKVEVMGEGFNSETPIKAGCSCKRVQVKSLGSGGTYVRVRLVPEWSQSSLSVSNIVFNLNSDNWTDKQSDGYYYFKNYLTPDNPITSELVKSISFTNLTPEYEGKTFTLKIVAEGVQMTNQAWKDVWGVTTLPFIPDLAWTP